MISLAPHSLLTTSRLPAWGAYALAVVGLLIVVFDSRALFLSPATNTNTAIESRSPSKQTFTNTTQPLAIPAIAALNLFGKVVVDPVIDIAALPTTKLNWKLVGIIGSSLSDESRSLIAIDNNPAKAYFKGDALPGGGIIYDIDSNFVIVRRGEQLEKLPLHAGNPVMSEPIRHSAPTKAVVDAPVHTEPVATPPVTAQTVYKDLEDRLASIRQKKSS